MNNHLISSSFFAALLIFSGATVADAGHHGKGRFMTLFDTNGDDVVTTEEFRAAAAERFKLMDSDKSGTVTQEEFRRYLTEKRKKWSEMKFQKIDVDKDGSVTESEYLDYKHQKAQRRFQQMDKDGNGIISEEEFKNNRRYGKKYGKHGKGKIFEKLDKNANGEITQEESLAAWTEWFTKIDSNGDKVVTADEVREYRKKNFSTKD